MGEDVPQRQRGADMLSFVAGTSPLSVRMGAWLDAHPMAALAVVALAIIVGGMVEGM